MILELWIRKTSLWLHAAYRHGLRPLRSFRLHETAEIIRRISDGFYTASSELVLGLRCLQRLSELGIQLRHDVGRCLGRREYAMPAYDLIAAYSGLDHGRHVRQRGRAGA